MLSGSNQLSLLGFGMVLTFLILIMARRLSALVALIVVPVAFALIGGFASTMGGMMLDGIRTLAPTGVMLMFAIFYFGIMNDTGLFDPLIRWILRVAKGDPLRILVGTALLALLVSLDGDGATTYIIVVTAMLPLYQRLKLNLLFLSGVVMLAVGITNIVPWGGPTARAASALHIDPGDIFTPMLPALFGSACWVLCVAAILGWRERKRLGIIHLENVVPAHNKAISMAASSQAFSFSHSDSEVTASRNDAETLASLPVSPVTNRLWVNFALTVGLITLLVWGGFPMPVLFMLFCAIALIINYPSQQAQKERLTAHAPNILNVVSLIFAAGIFTGILSGTKMVDSMTYSILGLVSPKMGSHLSVITALVSLPLTFFVSNDAFYFGMLPIFSRMASTYGIGMAEMGRAAIIGQPVHLLSPLVPSTYLLVNLAKVDLADHQRFVLLWAVMSCLVMLLIALLLGVIPA